MAWGYPHVSKPPDMCWTCVGQGKRMKKDSPIHGPRGPLSRPPDGPLGEAASGLIGCFCHSDPVDVISLGSIGIPMNKSEFEKMIHSPIMFSSWGNVQKKLPRKENVMGNIWKPQKIPWFIMSNLPIFGSTTIDKWSLAVKPVSSWRQQALENSMLAALHKWEISATEMARDPASTRLRS